MGEYNKTWVALAMAVLVVIEQIWGIKLGITEEWVTSLIAIIGTILVYLVPNTSA